MYRLQVKTHIDSAHYIADYQGKCQRMHGHRWEIEAVLEGSKLDYMNMIADFADIKACMEYVTDKFDHYILNNILNESNVTAEYLAKYLFEKIDKEIMKKMPHLKHRGVYLARITVWESPECCVKYYRPRRKKSEDKAS